eukprot:m.262318 g.262318  ORF g.262318 m.262318 type:complete len:288 (-) comp45153_c0_seq1:125-988(-)
MDPKSKPFQPLGVSRGPRPGLSKSAGLSRPFKPPIKLPGSTTTTTTPVTPSSSTSSSKTTTPKTKNGPARKNSGKRKNKKPRSENATNVGEAANTSGDQGHTKGTPTRHQKNAPSLGNNTKAKQATAGTKEKQQPSKKPPKTPSVNKPSGNQPSGNKAPKNKQPQISKKDLDVLKRVPDRFPSSKTDLYVSRNSDFSVQLGRAEKLFLSGQKNVCIHGLGAAINRAINLSLQLQMRLAFPVTVSATTSTVPLVDDLIPSKELLLGNQHEKTQIRNNSAIHIVLQKTM